MLAITEPPPGIAPTRARIWLPLLLMMLVERPPIVTDTTPASPVP